MKKKPMPIGTAIALFIIGLFLGSIFTFGMHYWNGDVAREDCSEVNAGFVSYTCIKSNRRPTDIKEIQIDCENNSYFIDGVSITASLLDKLSTLDKHTKIKLLIHPNSKTILEFSTDSDKLITFDDTIEKLGNEKIGFYFLGLFMYFCAGISLVNILPRIIRIKKR